VTIKEEDRNAIFFRRNIVIPQGSRCCKSHTVNDYLSREALYSLNPYKFDYQVFHSSEIIDIMKKCRTLINSTKHINFDDGFSLSDMDYKNLTGFTRAQHHHILTYIPPSALKNSINRSPEVAIACLLMKLKLGISNAVIASMLGIDNKRKVSQIIHSARLATAKHFVPHYLGLNHMTRRNVIEKHTSYVASRLLTENRDTCILILDGTYLYIQVS